MTRADGDGRMPRAGLLSRLLRDTRFEVMPFGSALEQAREIAPHRHVTVTSSPRHGVDRTVDLAVALADLGIAVTPHIAARSVRGQAHLEEVAQRLHVASVTSVFVIGGDAEPAAGPYDSAIGVLEDLSELPRRFSEVGIGVYPEGHPRIDDDALWSALARKSGYATYVTTQLCFDADRLIAWVERLRGAGIALPVRVGVPGPVQRKKLIEVSLRVGVGPSIRYLRRQRSLMSALVRRGGYDPTDLLSAVTLAAGEKDLGLAGLHMFTFNQLSESVAWHDDALTALEYDERAEARQY